MTSIDPLAIAQNHVQEGREIVARQRRIIAQRKTVGLDSRDAECVLAEFERTLATFEEDLQAIRNGRPLRARSDT
jgi:hypothetical protein